MEKTQYGASEPKQDEEGSQNEDMPGVGIQSTHRARRILHRRVVQGGELEPKWDEEGVHM